LRVDASLSLQLLEKGYDVHLAATGSAALDWLKSNSPDLAILDATTPLISGFNVCRSIRRGPAAARTRVLFLLPGCGLLERIEAQYAGSDLCLVKASVPPNRLLEVAEQFLDGSRGPALSAG
jgi:DNA-binding response OmpR family regulator